MRKQDSLEELFERLNGLEYVILRNHEDLRAEIANGGDMDILCADKEQAAEQIYAYPRVPGKEVFNYYAMAADKRIPIDIREVGDGYYDEAWEKSMLQNRVKTGDFYILDEENYKYSLLYHTLLHKPAIAEKYMDLLKKMFQRTVEEGGGTDRLLSDYLCEKGYKISIPRDQGVEFNEENCRRLEKAMKGITS